MRAVFWIEEVCFRYKLFDEQMTRQDVLDLNWHNVEADTFIVLHVKHTCELIFQPSIVVKCIYTEVLTILLFLANNKEGIGGSKAAVLLLLIYGSLYVTLCFVLCPFDYGVLTIYFCMLSSLFVYTVAHFKRRNSRGRAKMENKRGKKDKSISILIHCFNVSLYIYF